MFAGKHQPDRDALSTYLDGELAAERAAAIEAHVASCEACTEALEGMRNVRSMLRALPAADAPRSFRLRQADAEAPRRAMPAPPAPLMRLMPALSAAAVLVFALAVSFDAAGGDTNNTSVMSEIAQRTETMQYAPNAGLAGDDSATDPQAPAPGGGAERSTDGDGEEPDAESSASDSGEDGDTAADGPVAGAAPATAEGPFEINADVSSDDDGNNLALRIVQITSAAVAIAAAGVALLAWRRRSEGA